LETVRSTEKSTFPINANFAAESPSGFVGETPISVITATRGRSLDSISPAFRRKNYPNVKEKENAQVVDYMAVMANNSVSDVECAAEIGRVPDSFDDVLKGVTISLRNVIDSRRKGSLQRRKTQLLAIY
jgi:BRCT domain type II-containing protein